MQKKEWIFLSVENLVLEKRDMKKGLGCLLNSARADFPKRIRYRSKKENLTVDLKQYKLVIDKCIKQPVSLN
ncbi:MAG: hypothetical protein D3908_09490 [Candidatus Electrothrix sp. AUS4]|nr:hypothetical protein [Candidatus Electrothrix sp. AUS4]